MLFDATNGSILVILLGSVIIRDGVSFAQVPTSLMSCAYIKYFVLTVLAIILLLVQSVQLTLRGMKCLQNNTQSANTSLLLLQMLHCCKKFGIVRIAVILVGLILAHSVSQRVEY